MAKPKPTSCGVKIQTWGTHPGAGNGMLHFLDTKLFGGNVGHASVAVTFPANEQGKKLIEKYCSDPVIPYSKKKISVPKTDKTGNKSSPAHEEEVYEVYFSWWPSPEEAENHSLMKNVTQDSRLERSGVAFEWDPKWEKIIHPEKRKSEGALGSRIITLGAESIIHKREMSEAQFLELSIMGKITSTQNKLESINLLLGKLEKLEKDILTKENSKLSTSEKLMLDSLVPNWRFKIKSPETISKTDVQRLKESTDRAKQDIGEVLEKLFVKLKEVAPDNKVFVLSRLEAIKKIQENNNKLKEYLEKNKEGGFKVTEEYKILAKQVMSTWGENQKRKMNAFVEDTTTSETVDPDTVQYGLNVISTYIENTRGEFENYIKQQNDLLVEAEKRAEEHVIQGLPPDNVVSLPIASSSFPGTNEGLEGGLDVEKMLAKMKELTSKEAEGFDLYTKNCSKTVGAILESGAENRPDLRNFFQNKAFGFFGNPQEVYNNSIKFQAAVLQGNKPSLLSSIRDFNPLERAGGWVIGVITKKDDKLPWYELIGASVATLVVTPLALAGFLLRKTLDPIGSLKGLQGLGAYVFSKQSTLLKSLAVVAAIVISPLIITFAVLAPIQATIAGVANALSNLISPPTTPEQKRAKEAEIENETLQNLSPTEKFRHQQENSQRKILSKKTINELRDKMVEVSNLDPQKALIESRTLLENHQHAIPYFSKQAEKNIQEYLIKKGSPSEKAEYQNICQESLERVKILEAKIRKEEQEPKSKKTEPVRKLLSLSAKALRDEQDEHNKPKVAIIEDDSPKPPSHKLQ
jgi:hypothetical protein